MQRVLQAWKFDLLPKMFGTLMVVTLYLIRGVVCGFWLPTVRWISLSVKEHCRQPTL